MKYKAIFFDRDNTLTFNNPEKEKQRGEMIEIWSGKTFTFSYDKMNELFMLASEGRKPWYRNVDDEREFSKRYYYHMLVGEGVTEDLKIGRCCCLMNCGAIMTSYYSPKLLRF